MDATSPKSIEVQTPVSIPKPERPANITFLWFWQLVASIKKNLILKKRALGSSIFEVVLPLVFMLALVAGWGAANIEDNPARIYSAAPTTPLRDDAHDVLRALLCYRPGTPQGILVQPCSAVQTACLETPGFTGHCINFQNGTSANGTVSTLDGVRSGIMYLLNQQRPVLIPTLDTMLLLHQFVRFVYGPGDNDFGSRAALAQLQLDTGLMFAPATPETARVVARLNSTSHYFRHVYLGTSATEAAAEEYLYSTTGEGKAMSLVKVDTFSPTTATASFTLRFNRTKIPRARFVREQFSGGLGEQGFRSYGLSGFTTIQRAIHEALLQEMGVATTLPRTAAEPMPTAAYTDSEFLTIAGGVIPLVIVLAFMYPVSQLVKRIVEEKENRIREGMMIMGLGKVAFYGSWILTYIGVQFITSVLITLLLATTIFHRSHAMITWFLFFLFGVSSVMFAFMLSTFFSQSRVAALASPIIFCAISIPVFALPDDSSASTYQALSILSPSAFAIAMRTEANYEKVRGLQGADLNNPSDEITVANNIGFLILDIVLYFFLGLYFDNVLPSEWGTKLSPFFFLMPSYWCPAKRSGSQDEEIPLSEKKSKHQDSGLMEAPPSGQVPSIRVSSLKKVFHVNGVKKIAVDDLDLDWFPDQVNVLLGHNGAGKTTTI
eukprot:PhM_4_TR8289/c3_g2_i1/m.92598/K05643/ABCA3; ATP-binding cassette, subfamily A (ABC1), member 3